MKDLLKALIQAQSTADKGELTAAMVIHRHLLKHSLKAELISWDKTRANIVIDKKTANEKPALLFACHLDVVPQGEGQWRHPPFLAVEEDGKIYGRGSADMKGSIAALVTAVERFAGGENELKGDIIIAAVAGEETDSCGIKKFVADYKDRLPPLAGIIVAEPTGFEVITAHRGLLWLEVVTRGRTAHGSMPQLGVNAINSMRLFLDEFDKLDFSDKRHKLLGNCSKSINMLSAGKAINVVPDLCSVKIDMRTLPEQNHGEIAEKVRSIFDRLKKTHPEFEAEVRIVRNVEALETDNDSEFVRRFCSAVGCEKTTTAGFCTDGPFLTGLNAPIVIFGPGQCELCHKPDEYIEITELEKAVELYTQILTAFLL